MPAEKYNLPPFPCEKDVWDVLREEVRPIVVYGMGNGADKLIFRLREMGKDVTLSKAEEGMFTFRLTVCYYDEETKEATYRTFDTAAEKECSFTIYHYAKLAFEEIPTKVGDAELRWMRLDISLASQTEIYGHIVAFETVTEISGQMVPVTTRPYVPGKDEIPQ